jgi:uncharacterized damage-inducible protein DinB
MNDTLIDFIQHGPAHIPILDTVSGVNPEFRHKYISEFTSTIWEELEHMRIAQLDIIKYMRDSEWKSPEWPQGYWPAKKSQIADDEWQATVKGFSQDMELLVSMLQDNRFDPTQAIPHAPQHTYLREILLVIDHNAYHAGKILFIRKYFGDWPG